MSVITIQCKLVATEETRRALWHLMAEKHTPLINELLKHIAQDSRFEEWSLTGKLPRLVVSEACNQLKQDPQFSGQPGRFYSSAISTVHRIFLSWLALQTRLRNQISGQTRWLAMLQSDNELTIASQTDINTLRLKASELLTHLNEPISESDQPEVKKTRSKKKNQTSNQAGANVSRTLFKLYDETEDPLTRCAIAYLLKNGCKLPDQNENPEKFIKRRRKTEIRLERLMNTFQTTRIPRGRHLSWHSWIEALETATSHIPENEEEAAGWQARLLTKPAILPFPVNYETNEDLRWSLNSQGRICVSFNGLSEHFFEVYCDQRDLHWFNRFLEDQETKKASKNQHSSSLFSLRSGQIAWQEGKGDAEHWVVHRLVLSCSIETDTWTQEGTEEIRQKKASDCAKVIASTKAKENRSQNQDAFIRRRERMLELLENQFPRPSYPLYQGQPSILAGVSYGLDKPATLAIVNIQTGKAITYRSIRQILGKNYKLLNRYRLNQQRNAHKRHNNQRKGGSSQLRESNQGQYLDRLIAHEIVAIAQEYQVSSLALPDLGDIREIVQSEVQARAEQKILGSIEQQRKYARQYRASVHRWRYAQLTQFIQSQAAQVGISIEITKQPLSGTPQEKARNLAIAAYQSRK
ncbi:hypothetical protein NIES2135_47960 [Leptolyngbya boryana NIES-2135]|jgi:transposase|uniref:Uncharacterized protein n=1 Tax=Leptolyngbya boryana NIES-2135 TaxID=1973484 RepID=A0A1Z4JMQ4_LEPBY|nr:MULTISPECIES: type V CRISPR-associated protein Cas12k [Leptolyngbya]BAY57923.1 hypothetical protein NIES2135_47960 [Leptolyngbya boryana NIES-2135]MBD2367368.1 hypothetical protein [Leptolyngbya sp. FACHB-161]MBD2373892.1 hypothetical protein [Leptolyngbya sp. FACHB-238]MBD2398308.1 hypothetical protein [Leptolyngbya sp. FACHB-239]MBD2404195.1 hypothetical protein [Leptolyngbya sp. FACHB-402]